MLLESSTLALLTNKHVNSLQLQHMDQVKYNCFGFVYSFNLEQARTQYFLLLAQAVLLAPPEVALQCVAGHCYQLSVFFLSFPQYFGINMQKKSHKFNFFTASFRSRPPGPPLVPGVNQYIFIPRTILSGLSDKQCSS